MVISEKKQKLTSAEDVYKVMRSILKNEDPISQEREHFWVIGVNTKNVIQYIELCSLGTLNNSLVHPREIFRFAVSKGTNSIILCHNHPSGDPEPSKEDERVTEKVEDAGEILGIKLLDHVIIGDACFFSMMEKGYMANSRKGVV